MALLATTGDSGNTLWQHPIDFMSEKPKTSLPERTRKPGRPTDYTPDLVRKFCEVVGEGVPLIYACRCVGVSKQAVRNWRLAHPDFEELIQDAIAKAIQVRLDVIKKSMQSKDENVSLRAACWWLTHCPDVKGYYSSGVEISGPDGAPLAMQSVVVYLPAKGGSSAIEVGGDGRKEIENTDKTKGQS